MSVFPSPCWQQSSAELLSGCAQGLIERALVGAGDGLVSDLSVHICFICLLHLANEHSLRITGAPSLDSVTIHRI